MAVITISRQLGSSGEEVAQGLSERLGFSLIDRAGLEQLVLAYGLDEQDLDEIQERPPTLWQRLLSDRKLYLELVESFITDMAEQENFILLGRGGQCMFRGYPDALHIRFVASEETRLQRLKEADSLDRDEALKRLSESERDQRRFVHYLYGQQIDEPLLYDVVLRTDYLDVQGCIQVVVQAVGQRSLTVRASAEERPASGPTTKPGAPRREKPSFANSSEEEFARILDFYQIRWEYEPKTFPLAWDEEGRVTEAFSPDFYLVDSDTYIELTTLKQSLVTKKNRKLRRLKQLNPDVKVRIFYRKDFHNLLQKYGLAGKIKAQKKNPE